MKLGNHVILLVIAVLLQVAVAQTAPQRTPFSADIQATSGHGSAQDMTGKMYVNPGFIRVELNGGLMGASIMITDLATKTTDTIMPEQHIYMEFNADQADRRLGVSSAIKNFTDPGKPCSSELGETCKNLGVEEVNGRSCDHWETTDKRGHIINTWIDRELQVAVKSVTDGYSWQLTNIKKGTQDASLFQVPAGYQKMDLGQMMQGARPQQ